jgi:flagellar FliL protein
MGRKKETVEASGAETPTKKHRNNLVPALVVAAGLLGAGYFMSQGGGKANAAAATAGPTPTTTAKDANGEVDKINSVTINLADGHYVKLGLALQLKEGLKAADFDTQSARALDLAISTMGDRTMAQLGAPGGRDAAKDELSRKVIAAYNGKVAAIFFTEFVMQ